MVAPWGNTDILKTSVRDKYIAFENAIYAAVGDENGMVVDWPGLQMQMTVILRELKTVGVVSADLRVIRVIATDIVAGPTLELATLQHVLSQYERRLSPEDAATSASVPDDAASEDRVSVEIGQSALVADDAAAPTPDAAEDIRHSAIRVQTAQAEQASVIGSDDQLSLPTPTALANGAQKEESGGHSTLVTASGVQSRAHADESGGRAISVTANEAQREESGGHSTSTTASGVQSGAQVEASGGHANSATASEDQREEIGGNANLVTAISFPEAGDLVLQTAASANDERAAFAVPLEAVAATAFQQIAGNGEQTRSRSPSNEPSGGINNSLHEEGDVTMNVDTIGTGEDDDDTCSQGTAVEEEQYMHGVTEGPGLEDTNHVLVGEGFVEEDGNPVDIMMDVDDSSINEEVEASRGTAVGGTTTAIVAEPTGKTALIPHSAGVHERLEHGAVSTVTHITGPVYRIIGGAQDSRPTPGLQALTAVNIESTTVTSGPVGNPERPSGSAPMVAGISGNPAEGVLDKENIVEHFERYGRIRQPKDEEDGEYLDDGESGEDPVWDEEMGDYEDDMDRQQSRKQKRKAKGKGRARTPNSTPAPAPKEREKGKGKAKGERNYKIDDPNVTEDMIRKAKEGEWYEVDPPCSRCVWLELECTKYFRIGKLIRRRSCMNCFGRKVRCTINGTTRARKPKQDKGKGRAKAEDDVDDGNQGKEAKGKRKADNEPEEQGESKPPVQKKRKVKVEQPALGIAGPSNWAEGRVPRVRAATENAELYAALSERMDGIQLEVNDYRERMSGLENDYKLFKTGTTLVFEDVNKRLTIVEEQNSRIVESLEGLDSRTTAITTACGGIMDTVKAIHEDRQAERAERQAERAEHLADHGLRQLRPLASQVFVPSSAIFGVSPIKASQDSALSAERLERSIMDYANFDEDVFMDPTEHHLGDQLTDNSPIIRSTTIKREEDEDGAKALTETVPTEAEPPSNMGAAHIPIATRLSPITELPTPSSSFVIWQNEQCEQENRRSPVDEGGDTATSLTQEVHATPTALGTERGTPITGPNDVGAAEANSASLANTPTELKMDGDTAPGEGHQEKMPGLELEQAVPVIEPSATDAASRDPQLLPCIEEPAPLTTPFASRVPSPIILPPSSPPVHVVPPSSPPVQVASSMSPPAVETRINPEGVALAPTNAHSRNTSRTRQARSTTPVPSSGRRPMTRSSSQQPSEVGRITRSRSRSVNGRS